MIQNLWFVLRPLEIRRRFNFYEKFAFLLITCFKRSTTTFSMINPFHKPICQKYVNNFSGNRQISEEMDFWRHVSAVWISVISSAKNVQNDKTKMFWIIAQQSNENWQGIDGYLIMFEFSLCCAQKDETKTKTANYCRYEMQNSKECFGNWTKMLQPKR